MRMHSHSTVTEASRGFMPVVCGIRVGGIPNMAECHIPSFFVDLGSEPSENTLQATHSPNKKTELQENSSRKVKYLKVFYHLENHEGGRGGKRGAGNSHCRSSTILRTMRVEGVRHGKGQVDILRSSTILRTMRVEGVSTSACLNRDRSSTILRTMRVEGVEEVEKFASSSGLQPT